MAAAESPKQVHRTVENLFVQTVDELRDFWRAILPDFVKIVDPENSGFLEDLYSDQLLTHTDYESLVSGKDYMSRSQRTRKVWIVLSTYNLDLFRAKIAPKLLASFACIIPDRFFAPADQPVVTTRTQQRCLRHDVQNRIRVETMADLLCHHGCMPLEDYGRIINDTSVTTTSKWKLIFDTFAEQTLSTQSGLEPELQNLFTRYNVPFPDNMADFLSRGFPCTCYQPEPSPPDDVQNRDTKVKSWLERKRATVCQPSPASSWTRVDDSSLSSTLVPVSEQDTVSINNDKVNIFGTEDDNSWSPESAEYCINKGEDNKTHLQTEDDLSPSTISVHLPVSETDQEVVPDPNPSVTNDSSREVVPGTPLAKQQRENPILFQTTNQDQLNKNSSRQENTTVFSMETDQEVVPDPNASVTDDSSREVVPDTPLATQQREIPIFRRDDIRECSSTQTHNTVIKPVETFAATEWEFEDDVCSQTVSLTNKVMAICLKNGMLGLIFGLGPRLRYLLWGIARIVAMFLMCSILSVLFGRALHNPFKALEIVVAVIVIPLLAIVAVLAITFVVLFVWVFLKVTVKTFYILLKDAITGDTLKKY